MGILSQRQRELRLRTQQESSPAAQPESGSVLSQAQKRIENAPLTTAENNRALDFNNWLSDVGIISSRLGDEYNGRKNIYHTASDFGAYRDSNIATLDELLGSANDYRSYFAENADTLDADSVKWAQDTITEYERYLNRAKEGLNSEYDYWSQFADEADFNDFMKQSEREDFTNRANRKEALEKERNAIVRSLERTGMGDAARVAEIDKEIAALNLPKYNILDGWFISPTRKGVNTISQGFADTLALAEDTVWFPVE